MQQAYFTADNPRRLDCLSKESAGAADNVQDGLWFIQVEPLNRIHH